MNMKIKENGITYETYVTYECETYDHHGVCSVERSFDHCRLTHVEIPRWMSDYYIVKIIGSDAFWGCTSLKRV